MLKKIHLLILATLAFTAITEAKNTMYKSSIFPAASEREQWQKAMANPRVNAKDLIKSAEMLLDEPVPQTSASLFMRYTHNGDRLSYENPYFARRKNLTTLVLAECFEYKGRFINKIIDYLWEITSEHTWCVPAHISGATENIGDPLPFLKHENIDLMASSTAMDLAMTMNLLEKEISAVSKNIVLIVRRELMTRIIEPLEIRPLPPFFKFAVKVNNWRPWCSRNCLTVILYVLKDQPERQKKLITFFKDLVERHIREYSADGCCDEGAVYWGVNPGTVLVFYELLEEMPKDTAKYALMGDYINNALMTPDYFACFADAPPTVKGNVCGGLVYRYGERTGNKALQTLGMAHSYCSAARSQNMTNWLCNIFWIPGNASDTKIEVLPPLVKYYERLQTLFLRNGDLSFAAKRGFWGSHYHMDIGQFIIFYKSKPVIIDLGKTVYTRDTFSPNRYKNWIINADGHNIPQFNGVTQFSQPPRDPDAAAFSQDGKKCILTFDLTTAYPKEAQLKKCTRTITCDLTDNTVEVLDQWELERDGNTIRTPLYTPAQVTSAPNGYAIGDMTFSVDNPTAEVQITPLKIEDKDVVKAWGENINRIDLTVSSGAKGSYKMVFKPASK